MRVSLQMRNLHSRRNSRIASLLARFISSSDAPSPCISSWTLISLIRQPAHPGQFTRIYFQITGTAPSFHQLPIGYHQSEWTNGECPLRPAVYTSAYTRWEKPTRIHAVGIHAVFLTSCTTATFLASVSNPYKPNKRVDDGKKISFTENATQKAKVSPFARREDWLFFFFFLSICQQNQYQQEYSAGGNCSFRLFTGHNGNWIDEEFAQKIEYLIDQSFRD